MNGYSADVEALEHDATECFAVWSDTLQAAIPSAHSSIPRADFSFVPGSSEVWADYQRVSMMLAEFLTDGSAVFNGFARRLLETAQVYARADGDASATLTRLQSEIDDL
jgi:hypothetical protein